MKIRLIWTDKLKKEKKFCPDYAIDEYGESVAITGMLPLISEMRQLNLTPKEVIKGDRK